MKSLLYLIFAICVFVWVNNCYAEYKTLTKKELDEVFVSYIHCANNQAKLIEDGKTDPLELGLISCNQCSGKLVLVENFLRNTGSNSQEIMDIEKPLKDMVQSHIAAYILKVRNKSKLKKHMYSSKKTS